MSDLGDMIRRHLEAFVPPAEEERWLMRETMGPPLKLLKKPCRDCAVVWDFYRCFSDELKDQPLARQIAVSERWYCHNNRRRACRGNVDNLGPALLAALELPPNERDSPPTDGAEVGQK